MELDSLITEVKGVGDQRQKCFFRLGIYTVRDMLFHFPREYDDRSHIKKIQELSLYENNTFVAIVLQQGENIRIRNLIITRIRLQDETGNVYAVWYNQPYMKTALEAGKEYLFTGKLQKKYGKLEVDSPNYELIKEGVLKGQVVPIYPLTKGLSQKVLRGFIKEVIQKTENQLPECLPTWLRKQYHLCDKNFAIWNIHFPNSSEDFFVARRRLVFEEFFLLQLALSQLKIQLQKKKTGIILKDLYFCEEIQKQLPFEMTGAQKKVLQEIQQDMVSGKGMNRLVQGDVGSGKTAVALVVAYWAIQNGYQVAMMAPTEVLAEQHYRSFQEVFEPLGIKTVLLSGSLKSKEKRQVLFDITTGEAQMILGTHAVIQKNVVFQQLGLVITDEQHRFGVRQRGMLTEKGLNPHVLVMTATPIPRTLALILYGDLDISIINQLPPGRQEIDTFAVNSNYRERVYQFIKKHIKQGKQAYIVCPMIEENEKLDVEAVLTYTEKLKNEVFTEYNVDCVHGKLKNEEKQSIMQRFVDGQISVLVATTVIEVGINVPNAVIMVIENSERFGLAQLHQLRGRVGRGTEKSYCILMSDSKTKVARERMKVMEKSTDGFYISEMDLKLRGPGEFFGTRQHGLPELKIANVYRDMSLLKEAQNATNSLLINDSKLEKEEHQILKEEISRLWQNGLQI